MSDVQRALLEGETALCATIGGRVQMIAGTGETIPAGEAIFTVEAMKMESCMRLPQAVRITRALVRPEMDVRAGEPVLFYCCAGAPR